MKAHGKTPAACDVHEAGSCSSCSLAARGPVVLAFFATRSDRCIRQIDLLNGMQARYPGVQFAALSIRGDRGAVNNLIRTHRWTLPVGYDRDGAIANAYAVAVCPTITFAQRGGRVSHTTLGSAKEAEIARDIRAAQR